MISDSVMAQVLECTCCCCIATAASPIRQSTGSPFRSIISISCLLAQYDWQSSCSNPGPNRPAIREQLEYIILHLGDESTSVVCSSSHRLVGLGTHDDLLNCREEQ